MLEAIDALSLRIEALREQRAEHVDPLRFALILRLQQRLQTCAPGALQQQLQQRLQRMLAASEQALATARSAVSKPDAGAHPLQALRDVLDAAPRLAAQQPVGETGTAALEELQQLWRRLRIDSQLQKLRDSVPEDAGPLHSSALLYRAIGVMRCTAPGYLQHFIAYADTLVWLETLVGEPADTGAAMRGGGKPKRRRRAARLTEK